MSRRKAVVPAKRAPAEWADLINGAWRKTVEQVVETARLIAAAQEELDTEEWIEVRKRLDIGERAIDMLADIGRDTRIDVNHGSDVSAGGSDVLLPQSWRTLYELTTLTDAQWDYAVVRGLIHSGMERMEVARIKLLWNKEQNRDTAKIAVPAPLGRYAAIVVDPPWPVEKIERDVAPDQIGFEYPTMSAAALALFPLGNIAADDCHLFLWTTHKHFPLALSLQGGWGFTYVCTFVWHKNGGFQPFGLPMYNCEFVLYCRKGSPKFLDTKAFPTCFSAPRREHSRKPDEFYDMVRRVCDGPRIDVFSREPRDGFDQYGNEVAKVWDAEAAE